MWGSLTQPSKQNKASTAQHCAPLVLTDSCMCHRALLKTSETLPTGLSLCSPAGAHKTTCRHREGFDDPQKKTSWAFSPAARSLQDRFSLTFEWNGRNRQFGHTFWMCIHLVFHLIKLCFVFTGVVLLEEKFCKPCPGRLKMTLRSTGHLEMWASTCAASY